jgi:hypothetical protein
VYSRSAFIALLLLAVVSRIRKKRRKPAAGEESLHSARLGREFERVFLSNHHPPSVMMGEPLWWANLDRSG